MKKVLLPLLSVGLCASLQAQTPQRCSSHEYHQHQLAQHPEMADNEAEINRAAEHFANNNSQPTRAVVTIPVIFHVVYENASENISSNRILEQLQVLNEDYRKLNADRVNVPSAWQSLAADCEIQFCLAKRTPSNTWTDGINRVSTTVSSFDIFSDDVKSASTGGVNVWDRTKYLNIWVCDLGGGILGYAQFPGGPAATDGVVLDYRYTGKTGASAPYNKGRTATHEVGHWLGLYHIWGDDGGACSGSDQVSDTPNQGGENYGCFNVGQSVTDNCTATAPGVMWLNYMDYTDDACMYMFTTGQKTRMWSVLNGSRSSLLTSNSCTPVGIEELNVLHAISVYPSPSNGEVTVDFNGNNATDVDVVVYNTVGQAVLTARYATLSDSRIVLDLSDVAAGVYAIEISYGGEKTNRKVVIQ
ncbi:MAG: T9SS type A sorting domain-containing protein [Bacteroidetes bacterium]|nr:T9SS type A sorting domain-containing protein [Bacteroidota bacterium]